MLQLLATFFLIGLSGALITPLHIRQSFAWGVIGLVILFLVHWSSDLGWLTGLSWVTVTGRALVSPRIYCWVLVGGGEALLFFGVTFVIAGLRFLVTGEVSLG